MFARRLVTSVSLLTVAMAVLVANGRSCRAQAQSVPNLSGTWELVEYDAAKKKTLEAKFPRLILVIAQEESEIRITQRRTQRGIEIVRDYSFFTDGRGEANVGCIEIWPRELPRFASVSGWKKDKLVIKYDNQVRLANGSGMGPSSAVGFYTTNSVARRNDEWRLRPDGKTLVLNISIVRMRSPSPDQQASYGEFENSKLVFRKI